MKNNNLRLNGTKAVSSKILPLWISGSLVLGGLFTSQMALAGQASLGPVITQQTQMVINESSNAGEQKKEEFYRKLQRQLDEFDMQLEQLKSQSEALREKARGKFLERLEQLQVEKNQLLPKIEKATRSSEAAWEDIKGGLDRAVTDLKVGLKQAASNFF
ncbi:hypothetical protein [Candidatus Nitronereus thalassa]|uniref:OmpH family outer membrane protein n=1 Tax=Candidatus Nitronereus thalassa TaxID=3020898 RepID=A0ABU3K4J3_9BACT|nr:hypothetical protein [Candidatus Nitronereus thalassa]MDT7041311.1 hypothetical protein [Candidatus Nitronereus thalassa]